MDTTGGCVADTEDEGARCVGGVRLAAWGRKMVTKYIQ